SEAGEVLHRRIIRHHRAFGGEEAFDGHGLVRSRQSHPDPGTGEDRTDRTEDEGEYPEQPERVRKQIAHSLDRLEAAEDQSHAWLVGPGGGSGIRRRGGDCLARAVWI